MFTRLIPFFAILFVVLSPKTAHAYIDPGTGGLIIQLLIAAVATGAATVKLWWYKVKIFFKKDKSDAASSEATQPPQE